MPPFPGTPGDDILYGTDEADDMVQDAVLRALLSARGRVRPDGADR